MDTKLKAELVKLKTKGHLTEEEQERLEVLEEMERREQGRAR